MDDFRSALRETSCEDFGHCLQNTSTLECRNHVGRYGRMNASPEQHLIDVDIAQPGDERLVEQECLDRDTPPKEGGRKRGEVKRPGSLGTSLNASITPGRLNWLASVETNRTAEHR